MRIWPEILLAVVTFLIGYTLRGLDDRHALTTAVADTIVVRDTLRYERPTPVAEIFVEEVPTPIPVYLTALGDTVCETVYAPIPITRKTYETEDYRAVVSGFRPSLDTIAVYPEKVYIKEKARRWGLGVIGGYGVGLGGFSPYVGVGVYYRIW